MSHDCALAVDELPRSILKVAAIGQRLVPGEVIIRLLLTVEDHRELALWVSVREGNGGVLCGRAATMTAKLDGVVPVGTELILYVNRAIQDAPIMSNLSEKA